MKIQSDDYYVFMSSHIISIHHLLFKNQRKYSYEIQLWLYYKYETELCRLLMLINVNYVTM